MKTSLIEFLSGWIPIWFAIFKKFKKKLLRAKMQNWQHFSDSRFVLGFQYPQITPEGHHVEWTERHEIESVRVHFRSKDSREIYFEITRYFDLTAQAEYQRHTESLEKREEQFVVSELKEIRWLSQPAYEYSLKWGQGARIVRLIQVENDTYRIIYDPKSPLNAQILSTILWKY